MKKDFYDFLDQKAQMDGGSGFEPKFLPDFLFDFQKHLVEWSVRKGRSALFVDTGLGKTAMQLTWAQNVVQETNRNVLILAPLAVGWQTENEGNRFGIETKHTHSGKIASKITITNYEQLKHYDPNDFIGVVCDESSILKNYDGEYRNQITAFLRKIPYRLLCTATAAPNDYTELGTSSEALGYLGHIDMLTRFFKNQNNTIDTKGHFQATNRKTNGGAQFHEWENRHWRFKGHAEQAFWRFVCSWSRAMRKPSDMGFSDEGYILPPKIEELHVIEREVPLDGYLFQPEAVTLGEQREERKSTIKERCEKVAELTNHNKPALIWCHLNEEGKLLKHLVKDSVEVSGSDSTEFKEEKIIAFVNGEVRALITKPKVAGFGMNFQHCSHIAYFPSNSYEQYYQSVRRCYRFGQKNEVKIDLVATQGEKRMLKNLQRKATAADQMFSNLVAEMQHELSIERKTEFTVKEKFPKWL